MTLNSVNIMGNLTRDPELKYTNSGAALCNLSIANNRVYTSKAGEKVEEVSFFDVEVWGAVAENCGKYLTKGSGVIIEGRLKQDRWEKDGQQRSRVRISATNIHFMPKRAASGGGGDSAAAAPSASTHQQPSGEQLSEAVAWDE